MIEWISVEERLPGSEDVHVADGFQCVLVWEKTNEPNVHGVQRLTGLHSYLRDHCTHWMPLPEPPK